MSLDWKNIDEKWQKRWSEAKIFEANPIEGQKKVFITVAYPYPNSPWHIGHGRTYTLPDVYARFKRMQGYNVLFPMAFHYTGTPVLAIAKRVAANDKELLDDFTNLFKVPSEVLKTFVDPLKIAEYFHEEIKTRIKEIGYSIDWRREFTTIDPPYSRFIEWQFRKLRSKGFITRGSHPVGWCKDCSNPMGQHDTKGDVEPEIGELTLVKFRFGNDYLPTGTLRPETIFGVTNIWIKPDVDYVTALVDGETWIVSVECAEKLSLLERQISVVGKVKGNDLIGKSVINPVTGEKVPIFPASFVDPKNATGVVMSVPGHAPYDYIALEDLKNDEETLTKFNLNPDEVRQIKPISLISLEGYSDIPAKDVILRLGIKNQTDEKIEEATKEIYSQEFNKGKMKENTGKYAGLSVSIAKEKVKEELTKSRDSDIMYELLNRPVYCRCGSELFVKIFKDQWFIDYGNYDWKMLTHKCLDEMQIFPEELRTEFHNVIDWLKEKACARKQGLGTKIPWDSEWTIESLSDSTIYMSYYTISKTINENDMLAKKLDDEVFDYIFLGIGNPDQIGKTKDLSPLLLKEMRGEFTYFYPLDNRYSGRDLVTNHLTYFIFNHVAIFQEQLWPKAITVNGVVLMEGKKMSKSLGNTVPLRNALDTYGADPLRIAVVATAELLQDADFSDTLAKSMRERLERFYSFALKIIEMEDGSEENSMIDKWFLSRLQQRIKSTTDAMENMRLREAINSSFYLLDQDLQWYLRRSTVGDGQASPSVLKKLLEIRVLLLAPLVPHICEEIWERMGKKSFISTSGWPSFDESQIDLKIIEGEELVNTLRDDVSNIIQVTKTTPKKIFFYTASSWKWDVYLKALKMIVEGHLNTGDLMGDLMAEPELRQNGKVVSSFVQKIVVDIRKMPLDLAKKRFNFGTFDEKSFISNACSFLAKEFGSEVTIYIEDDNERYDPKGRSKFAEPYRLAIYIE